MQDDVQDKKEAIIRASLKLFTERGFHGTPTSMISQGAGVATGTLFRYFPTKEDLINSTYSFVKSHMAAAMKAGIDGEPTIEGKARRIWANSIRWGLENPEEFHFIEQFASSPYITRITEKEALSNFAFLADVFEKGIRQGVIRDGHGELLAYIVYDANKAVIKKIMRSGTRDDVDEIIDASFELLWNGMGNGRSDHIHRSSRGRRNAVQDHEKHGR